MRRLPSRFGSKLGGPVLPLRVQCLDQVRDVLARARGEQAAGREERGTLDGSHRPRDLRPGSRPPSGNTRQPSAEAVVAVVVQHRRADLFELGQPAGPVFVRAAGPGAEGDQSAPRSEVSGFVGADLRLCPVRSARVPGILIGQALEPARESRQPRQLAGGFSAARAPELACSWFTGALRRVSSRTTVSWTSMRSGTVPSGRTSCASVVSRSTDTPTAPVSGSR